LIASYNSKIIAGRSLTPLAHVAMYVLRASLNSSSS